MNLKTSQIISIVILISGSVLCRISLKAQDSSGYFHTDLYSFEYVFPFQDLHVHSSSIVELPDGDLLCCWFEGSGERTANDVVIMGARLSDGGSEWSKPFIMADTPGHPDCNPVLFVASDKRLHLFWIVVQANKWESSILKWRVSSNYMNGLAPEWDWQDVILLKPGEEFATTINEKFKESGKPGLAWAEYSPRYENQITNAAKEPKKRETGWMTRTHPVQLASGRILLPLYSDGFNLSLIAISDDNAETWTPSLPIVGRGNVQPSIVLKADGSLVAFMRNNGDMPSRIMTSISTDSGYEWSAAKTINLPNPGSSVEAIALSNGDWLLTYNDTENGRHSLAVSLSDDEGKTWKWTRHLEKEKKGIGSFAYPSVIQSEDDLIHISYSYHLKNKKTIKHVTFSTDWVKKKE